MLALDTLLNYCTLFPISVLYIVYVICLLTGPPGEVTDLKISSNTVTACSFVVQWSRPSSHPVCGIVEYMVTVSLEGRIISSNNTVETNYIVAGLNSRTMYTVNVNASNNAGISCSAVSVQAMINSGGKFIFCMWVVLCIHVHT